MQTEPDCPDCRTGMEKGFIPDSSYGTILQTMWHPGESEDQRFFGLRTGSIKVDKSDAIPIIAYRCPDCGLLRAYAP